MRKFKSIAQLSMRFSDGGAQPPAPADPTPPAATPPATPAATPPATPPAATPPATATPPAKTFSEADVTAAKEAAIAEYKKHLEEAKDYEKMTPEEKVAYLEAQRADDKLSAYATQKLSASNMPVELLAYAKGTNEADTDTRIKELKAIIDKGVQSGVEARFKNNSYVPRGNAAAAGAAPETKSRSRGVTVQ
ncbi:MAG: DUF4355 domain-containing protein [Candidatus Fimivivens sp.]